MNRLAITLCLLIVTGIWTNQAIAHSPAEAMTEAAQRLIASLSEDQVDELTFDFDDGQRANWQFIPMEREGLSLKEMKPAQQHLGIALISSALSHKGLDKALNIMALEQILHEMENNSPTRDPQKYHFFVFGKPSTVATWGWRIEGHHLSVSFTIVDGKKVVTTPAFMGANPAQVKSGPHKGLRVLSAEEDLGRELVTSLSKEQAAKAIVSQDAPDDVINGPGRKATPLEPMGIAANELNDEQKGTLKQLIGEYVQTIRPDLAEEALANIRENGVDKIYFAWAGGVLPGERHYYRVQGPSFIMEYDNTQNDANHIHVVWRDFKNDLGEDLLKKHYDKAHAK